MDHAAGHTAAHLARDRDGDGQDDLPGGGSGSAPTAPFAQRLHARMEALGTHVCMGIDPRPDLHPSTHPASHAGDPAKVAKAVVVYFRDLIDAAADDLACVKLQSAFFERMGVPGLIGMAQLLADARERDIPVILDAKRGDVGSTAEAYADAYLGGGVFAADALTVQPYLGMDAIEPFVLAAQREHRGVFVLVRTSNPGGADLQELALADTGTGAVTVADRLADLLTERAREAGVDAHGYGPLGAVVGGTVPERLASLRRRLPHSILLVPGYGAQGASAEGVRAAFDADGLGAVVSASRSLTYRDGDDPPREAAAATRAMRDAIRAAIASG
ncbi:MAG: orotidine-5'-phosphate decarboxylase [Trueperaceae bacterium]|nr:orotidine-5'-phosphate decarboxylase [Trueperaceae bacterium]